MTSTKTLMLAGLAVVSLGVGTAMAQQSAQQVPAATNQATVTTTRSTGASQDATAQYGSSDRGAWYRSTRPEDMDSTAGGF